MTPDHPEFRKPTDRSIKLWRYMDVSKFIRLLITSNIFFPKAKYLGDPFECSVSKPTFDRMEEEANLQKQREKMLGLKEGQPIPSMYGFPSKALFELIEKIKREFDDNLKHQHISCWHANNYESAAMWKLYSKSDESISIVTDFDTFDKCLPDFCLLGMVKYADYDNEVMDISNGFNSVMTKRMSFEHEKEVRAVLWEHSLKAIVDRNDRKLNTTLASEVYGSRNEYGMAVPIDLNLLVKAVYINPLSTSWFADTIESLIRRLGYEFNVYKSSLSLNPIY